MLLLKYIWYMVGMAFSSGLAACMTAINMLKAGDHVLTTDDVYGGTNR